MLWKCLQYIYIFINKHCSLSSVMQTESCDLTCIYLKLNQCLSYCSFIHSFISDSQANKHGFAFKNYRGKAVAGSTTLQSVMGPVSYPTAASVGFFSQPRFVHKAGVLL